eukprot:COSAG05_NODE_548_length_8749_cov_33.055838_14_plen_176_part_00
MFPALEQLPAVPAQLLRQILDGVAVAGELGQAHALRHHSPHTRATAAHEALTLLREVSFCPVTANDGRGGMTVAPTLAAPHWAFSDEQGRAVGAEPLPCTRVREWMQVMHSYNQSWMPLAYLWGIGGEYSHPRRSQVLLELAEDAPEVLQPSRPLLLRSILDAPSISVGHLNGIC